LQNKKHAKKTEKMAAFLKAPATQIAIADALRWVPASRDGKPYNNLARQAQLAWFGASFVWQRASSETALQAQTLTANERLRLRAAGYAYWTFWFRANRIEP
jgi:hypothetical protein